MAPRIRSRISAAAFSVNVTATMRIGSTPDSRSSTYTSTSLCVFPVPALAQTTVLLSNAISLHTACTTGDTRSHYTPGGRPVRDAAGRLALWQQVSRSGLAVPQTLSHRWYAQQPECSASEAAD